MINLALLQEPNILQRVLTTYNTQIGVTPSANVEPTPLPPIVQTPLTNRWLRGQGAGYFVYSAFDKNAYFNL